MNNVLHRLMRPGLVDAQAFQQPPELLRAEAHHLGFAPGPLISSPLQPFVQQDETIGIPVERLEPIHPLATEQKQGIGKRIQVKTVLDKTCQSVYPAAQIGIPACDVNMLNLCRVKHFTSPRVAPAAAAQDHTHWPLLLSTGLCAR